MNQRLYDRLAAGFSILLLAVLAAASYYLAQMADRGVDSSANRAQAHEPDYFAEAFRLTRLNTRGEPVYRMSATRMNHYPDDDSIDYVHPVLVSLDPTKPVLTVRAGRGTTSTGGVDTRLYDNVQLTRAAFGTSPPMRIDSQYLQLLSDGQDIAQTDRPVRISYGTSELDGTGMLFNNDTRQLQVFSNVRGRWVVPPAKAQPSDQPPAAPKG